MNKRDFDIIENLWGKVNDCLGKQVNPRLLAGGKAGVGKSSLLNAILGNNVYEIDVIPCTKKNDEEIWKSKGGDIVVIDVPGFSEAEAKEIVNNDFRGTFDENIINLAETAHMLLYVLKADDRALEPETNFLERWNNENIRREMPIIVAINQIDKMNPTRDWDPGTLDLKTPRTQKEKNIRKYIDYISGLAAFAPIQNKDRIMPVAAGESHKDPNQYGIDDLKECIYNALPDSAKTIFARAAELKKQESKRIIKYYAGACAAAVGANFLPASDALVLAPLQIAMIVHLGKLHNIEITIATATGLFTSIGLSFAGRYTCQVILSLFPGIKNIVGPGLAFSLTYSMGLSINELFAEGKLTASNEEFNDLAKKLAGEGKKAIEDYKR